MDFGADLMKQNGRGKAFLKKVVPVSFRRKVRELQKWLTPPEKRFKGMQPAAIFDVIYREKLWGEDEHGKGTSGSGSHDPHVTVPYVDAVSSLLAEKFYDAIVDLGCGDFTIGRRFIGLSRRYIACDISEVILERVRVDPDFRDVEFRKLDLARDELPVADLAIVRQVLQHLSNTEIQRFVRYLNSTKCFRELLVTEHLPGMPGFKPNKDKPTGNGTRVGIKSGVVLHAPPFSLNYKSMRVLCEVPKETSGIDAVVRSTLYEL
jgi:hypothetical protein